MAAELRWSPEWPAFAGADWAERILNESVTDRLHEKQGRAIARWTLNDGKGNELIVFLKRHFRLPKLDGLFARLMPKRVWSPGLQEWNNLEWAAGIGIPVPRSMAAGEFRGPGLKLQSFLATEELAGMLPLHEAVPLAFRQLPPEQFTEWKRGLIAEMARLTVELHRRRMYHADLYFCHFYIEQTDCETVATTWKQNVWMIDFHRLGRHRLGWQWFAGKDLAQWIYSSDVPGILNEDREQFWNEYRCGNWGSVSKPPQWLWNFSKWKAERYQRHHDRKAARKAGAK